MGFLCQPCRTSDVTLRFRQWAVLAAVCLLGAEASANPADTFGFGSRSTALGGSVAGKVTDFSANYYNPSGLAFIETTRLNFGFIHVSPSLEYDGVASDQHDVNSWQAGIVIPGKILQTPVAFGVAAQIAGARLSRVVTFTDQDQRWFLYENRPEQMYLTANVAIRLLDNLSIGAGIAFLTSTDGNLTVTGRLVQPNVPLMVDEYSSVLEHELLAELRASRYPVFGLTWAAHENWDVGLSYRGEGGVELNVDAKIEGEIQAPFTVPTHYMLLSKTSQAFVPRQWTLGVRHSPAEALDIHVALRWVDWAGYQSPVSATRAELEIDEPPGLTFMLPELPEPTRQQSAGLKGRLVPHIGLEQRFPADGRFTFAGRLGYFYERSPLASGSDPVLLDGDRHVISAGAGVEFGPLVEGASSKLELNAHLQLGIVPEQHLGGGASTPSISGHFAGGGAVLGLRL